MNDTPHEIDGLGCCFGQAKNNQQEISSMVVGTVALIVTRARTFAKVRHHVYAKDEAGFIATIG
jgi:hypothetical protein